MAKDTVKFGKTNVMSSYLQPWNHYNNKHLSGKPIIMCDQKEGFNKTRYGKAFVLTVIVINRILWMHNYFQLFSSKHALYSSNGRLRKMEILDIQLLRLDTLCTLSRTWCTKVYLIDVRGVQKNGVCLAKLQFFNSSSNFPINANSTNFSTFKFVGIKKYVFYAEICKLVTKNTC